MKARILLEDGTLISGKGFGFKGTTAGELVFNTGMTGYQEILTDPSYAGQIVTLTYPLVGNYGINQADTESQSVQVSGFVVKEYADAPSHWEMKTDINTYLKDNKIVGVCDVDTRMITKRIRNQGAMYAVISNDETLDNEQLKEVLRGFEFPKDIVNRVSTNKVINYKKKENDLTIAVIDLGVKQGIIKQLQKQGCNVIVYPYDTKVENLDLSNIDGVLLSNGPGDPKDCHEAIDLAKKLHHMKPVYGICLGHQILALSMGADTYKLKFGHRGSNHPVMNLSTHKVFMTSQNHGYAVSEASLTKDMLLTHINVNDETIEGIQSKDGQIVSVQFHPEEGPGPTDAVVIFKEWISTLRGNKTCL